MGLVFHAPVRRRADQSDGTGWSRSRAASPAASRDAATDLGGLPLSDSDYPSPVISLLSLRYLVTNAPLARTLDPS